MPNNIEPWLKYFSPEHIVPDEINDTEELLQCILQQQTTLIRLSNFNETRNVYEGIVKEAKKKDPSIPTFYIESAQDIEDFIALQSIHSGKLAPPKPGPLAEFLQQADGILVVNWERFTPPQIASFKSLMDKPPTLKNVNVHPNKKIINLASPSSRGCVALLSRTKHIDWPADIKKPFLNISLEGTPFEEDEKESKNTLTVELFDQNDSWQKELLGNVQYTKKGFEFTSGLISQAVQEKKILLLLMHHCIIHYLMHLSIAYLLIDSI